MELNQKITGLESEIKLIMNEFKETLLDIRETLLNHQNPFTRTEPLTAIEETKVQTVVIQHEEPEKPQEALLESMELQDSLEQAEGEESQQEEQGSDGDLLSIFRT